MKFEVTPKQQEKVDEWLKTIVYPAMIEKQKAIFNKKIGFLGKKLKDVDSVVFPIYQQCWDMGYPYEGAVGPAAA